MTSPQRQPWIGDRTIEILFILLPPFASLAFIAFFPSLFQDNDEIPVAWWVILILLVDVAHVYSTLYRTYCDPAQRRKFRAHLFWIPVVGLLAGVGLYAFGPWLFWRVLAYLAVYHFVRQQYGFMRIYSREEKMSVRDRRIDMFTIYYSTIYPLLYWHLGAPRNFNWFVDDDFFLFRWDGLLTVASWIYYLMILVYVVREVVAFIRTRYINIPRVAILAGTLLSWYFGIVYFNGDMAFTLLNVVSHGIPYMALIWLYGKKAYGDGVGGRSGEGAGGNVLAAAGRERGAFIHMVFGRYGIFLFLGIIFLLAWLEEGLWDMTVWKEHVSLFSVFHMAGLRLHGGWLTLIVPLLALPQLTHYIIDGFIWVRSNRRAQ